MTETQLEGRILGITNKLLHEGWDRQIKVAHDAYWQGREDERNNIDSPYFDPISEMPYL